MAPKRTSTSATSTMTQAAIRKLVTYSIAATLEEVANIAQRLMDQVLKHGSVQGTNDHKQKFDDRRNATNNNNNYRNNNRNNNYHQQHNRRQESVRTHAATLTKNKKGLSVLVGGLSTEEKKISRNKHGDSVSTIDGGKTVDGSLAALVVLFLELDRFGILLGEREEGMDKSKIARK
ncbi:hypothetical protein Tco_0215008 [Tanacetum coccineum]